MCDFFSSVRHCRGGWDGENPATQHKKRPQGARTAAASHLGCSSWREPPKSGPALAALCTVSGWCRPLAQRHHSRSSSSVVLPPPPPPPPPPHFQTGRTARAPWKRAQGGRLARTFQGSCFFFFLTPSFIYIHQKVSLFLFFFKGLVRPSRVKGEDRRGNEFSACWNSAVQGSSLHLDFKSQTDALIHCLTVLI